MRLVRGDAVEGGAPPGGGGGSSAREELEALLCALVEYMLAHDDELFVEFDAPAVVLAPARPGEPPDQNVVAVKRASGKGRAPG